MKNTRQIAKQKLKPLVSIIIVNWNGLVDLKACLASLKVIAYPNYEIIIVDNGSTDGSQKYVRDQKTGIKNLTLIENKKNLGYAAGNNIGYKKAKGSFLLLLNNDTVIESDFLSVLVQRIIEDQTIGGIQPRILQYPNKKLIDSVGSYFIKTGFLYHYGHNKHDQRKYDQEGVIFTMKGACMLLRKSVIDAVGLFDPSYFAYFEETDLCMRIWLSGHRILYYPKAIIYHKGGETFKKLQLSFVLFHSYKNRMYTYAKNFELQTAIVIMPLHSSMCLLVTITYIVTGKFDSAYAIFKAFWWVTMHIATIVEERKKIAALRKIKDKDYLPQITKPVRVSYYYHLFTTSLRGYQD